MLSQWVQKRVGKFLLKRLFGRIIRGDLDSEQLEVQLRSGTIQLNDLVLNTDYLNDQLCDASVAIKEGSIGSLTLNFPWRVSTTQQCEIEVDDLELVITPRAHPATNGTGIETDSTSGDGPKSREVQSDGLEPDFNGLGFSAGCTYLGVHDGVRMIAKIVEKVLLGMRVRIRNTIVAFEGELPSTEIPLSDKDLRESCHHISHSMLVIRIGQIDYGVDAPPCQPDVNGLGDNLNSELAMLVKLVRFSDAVVEVLDVLEKDSDHSSCPILSTKTAGGRIYGQPVPVIVGEDGLFSGSIQLSMPWRTGCISVPKFNVEISIAPLRLKVSVYEIQQLLHLFSSIGDGEILNPSYSPGSGGSQSNITSSHGRLGVIIDTDCTKERQESVCSLPSLSSQVFQEDVIDSDMLPATRVISDWMLGVGSVAEKTEGFVVEADLESSVDEFFECFDGSWNSQASLCGSGLWTWTCSAFSAITAASSIASGSILIPQDLAKQVECDIKLKLHGISACLCLEHSPHYEMLNSGKENARSTGLLSQPALQDAASQVDLVAQSGCVSGVENKGDAYLEAQFLDIDMSFQASDQFSQLKLTVECIDVSEYVLEIGDIELYGQLRKSSCTTKPLQSLIEDVLPVFPVSYCAKTKEKQGMGNGSWDGCNAACSVEGEDFSLNNGSFRRKYMSSSYRKRGLFRLPAARSFPSVHLTLKQDFLPLVASNKDLKFHRCTHVELQLQPIVLWFDVSTINRLLMLFERGFAQYTCHAKVSSVPRNSVHMDIFVPCIRILVCFPLGQELNLLKDHFLCVDLHASVQSTKAVQPFIAVRHCINMESESNSTGNSLVLGFTTGTLHIVSSLENVEYLAFSAQRVLEISNQGCQDANVDIRWKGESRGGPWIAHHVWDRIMTQRKRDGGNGVGGRNSEFAAVTYAEEEETNKYICQDIILCSPIFVHFTLPHLRLELFGLQHILIFTLVDSFFGSLLIGNNHVRYQNAALVQDSGDCHPAVDDIGTCSLQTSIFVDATVVEMAFHPQHPGAKGNMWLEGKGIEPWKSLRFEVQKFQLMSVSNLGRIDNVSYLWLQHEDGKVWGTLSEACGKETLLLCCQSDAVGRGDGGGNAWTAGSAGVEVACITWPGKCQMEEVLVNATIRGGTIVAHGGRLDWLPTLVSFFCQSLDEGATRNVVMERIYLSATETDLFSMKVDEGNKVGQSDASSTTNHSSFFLHLHDVALCYDPSNDVLIATNGSMTQTQASCDEKSTTVEPVSSVACILAAAAVRISSSVTANRSSKEYDIWLRDLALLLLDTSLRRDSVVGFTPESLHRSGYVKVAGEAVMEATVRINSEDGLQWEVECANNQLRLHTCHDTTAALGRLISQLQQLCAPDFEPPTVHVQARKGELRNDKTSDVTNSYRDSSVHTEDVGIEERLQSKLVNCGKTELFASVLEDAFAFVRDSPSKLRSNAEFHGGDLDFDDLQSSIPVFSGRSEFPESSEGRCDMTAAAAVTNTSSSAQNFQHLVARDVQVPCSLDVGFPSFVEDYYATKNIAPHSSQSCRFKQPGEVLEHLEGSAYSDGGLDVVEGNGGWYDGQSFRVLENHVPDVGTCRVHRNPRDISAPLSNKLSSLAVKFPQSIGRVVLQDLNVRWRLYGGSDWPDARMQKQSVLVNSNQHGERTDRGVSLEVVLDGVDLQHDIFPETGLYSSRLVVSVQDIKIYDCSKDAPWKMVLGYHVLSSQPRISSAKAVKLDLEAVRPDPLAPLEEYRLSVDLLPIRLHLDQRHIDFFINFFPSHSTSLVPQGLSGHEVACSLDAVTAEETETFGSKAAETNEEALLPFFQICEMRPITICVDYVPHHLDLAALRRGNYAELFNLVSWKGVELELKHICAKGVHGWATLSDKVFGEWLEDISRYQVHKLIQGLGPVRPFFAMGTGAAKLIVVPLEHYQRDQCLLQGMRKGAVAFLRSLSIEAVQLGVHLAAGAHGILLNTESALSWVPPSSPFASDKGQSCGRVIQPGDTCEGLQQACESLTRGLERTATSLIGKPMKVYQRGAGASLAVASALRAAPAAALAPAAAAAGAVHCALLGVRNSLDPAHKRV